MRTSKAANAAALTNTVAIIANERTYITPYSNARNIDLPRGLQWFQRITMSVGTGPSRKECHCADADGDHCFSYDEEPQGRQKHEEAAHDDDCRLGRETFRCWDRGAHCSLHRKTGRYVPIVALTPVLGLVRPCQSFVL